MTTLIYLALFSLSLLVCFLLGKLIRPNKSTSGKVIGFLGLVFIGPLIYSLLFLGASAAAFGNEKIEQSFLNFLFLGMFLSPFIIFLSIYTKKNATKIRLD